MGQGYTMQSVPAVETSPRSMARVAGLFYLLTFVTGVVAAYADSGLFVSSDAQTTAANILAHPLKFQLGIAAYLINVACYIAVTALFYRLFKPVIGSVSLIAAFFSLVGCAIQASACLFQLGIPVVLKGAPYLDAFKPEQTQGVAFLFLKLYVQDYNIGLVFFGFYCALIGWLAFRAAFLPRIVGVMMLLAGLAWLTFLWPPLADASRIPTIHPKYREYHS